MLSHFSRREYLKTLPAMLGGLGYCSMMRTYGAEGIVLPGNTVVRQPVIDLQFDDHSGAAQWWLPELVLLGNTDVRVRTQGPADWKEIAKDHWGYQRKSADGRLKVKVEVERIELGWIATLTLTNLLEEKWSEVVSPICLLLYGSGTFQDPDWKRTYFRSGGKFLPYQGRETDGGKDTYRMTLVRGREHLERSERHRGKWGFTTEMSDDGIIGVMSETRSTVLTTTWQPTHHLQANRKRSYSCIHANVYFGKLAAGETKTRRGCVLLVPGGLEEAWEETKRVLKEGLLHYE